MSYRLQSLRPATSRSRTIPGILKLTIVPDSIVRDNDRSHRVEGSLLYEGLALCLQTKVLYEV